MKSITFTQYGSPDVLKLSEIEQPSPNDDQVLVKVYSASANPADWHIMRGAPFLARLEFGLRKPKISRLGCDVAGRVEAIGKNVTQFKVGDDVYGCAPLSIGGSFAEFLCVREDLLVLKPAHISYESAAAAPLAALTALQGLRDKGRIRAGQSVLVNGASGGVGTYAVQIAKSYNTEVTGVCSTRNLELVRSIGADHVIDYTQTDFTRNTPKYDLIFDAIGNRSISDLRRVLKPDGVISVAGFTSLALLFQTMLQGALMKTMSPNQADMLALKKLMEEGKVVSVIDRRYPLSETAEAIRYLETGRARGKVVINVVPEN
jgi:NADPH:quinone reductase-like Zn-dependent oxidoreductase